MQNRNSTLVLVGRARKGKGWVDGVHWAPPSLVEGLLIAADGAEREGDGASNGFVLNSAPLRSAPAGGAVPPWPAVRARSPC